MPNLKCDLKVQTSWIQLDLCVHTFVKLQLLTQRFSQSHLQVNITDHIFELRRKCEDVNNHCSDVHIILWWLLIRVIHIYLLFKYIWCIFTIHANGYITHSQHDQLPVGLMAQLVEHCSSVTNNNFITFITEIIEGRNEWMTHWLIDCLTVWMIDSLTDWRTG